MSPVDIVIILLALLLAIDGYKRGAVKQLGIGAGLLIGLAIGAGISTLVGQAVGGNPVGMAAEVVITVGFGGGLAYLGGRVGARAKRRIVGSLATSLDHYGGVVVGIIGAILLGWLGAMVAYGISSTTIQNAILGSRVVILINDQSVFGATGTQEFRLIDPNPNLNIGQLVSGAGLPAPYNLTPDALPQGTFAKAVAKDYPSVVFVLWGPSCQGGGSYEDGSGYVAAPHIVVTAAHVVAGAGTVTVIDSRGTSRIGDVILFDAKHDVAVVYVPGLTASPLTLDPSTQKKGEPVALLGYPGQAPFTATTDSIRGYDSFSGFKLGQIGGIPFGHAATYYYTQAGSHEGNSGGPLITQSGAVVGHFTIFVTPPGFTTSFTSTYVVALSNYYSELHTSEKQPQRVSTGSCPVE